MRLSFTKMNGLGNDYIFVNAIDDTSLIDTIIPFIPKMSDRHFGIGGDGVIFIASSDVADFQMRMFNSDGREGEMCGNGIRELARYVYSKNLSQKNPLAIETKSGIRTIHKNGELFSVQMGQVNFDATSFCLLNDQKIKDVSVFEYESLLFYVGSVGSRHAVCFMEQDVTMFDFYTLGHKLDKDKSIFYDGANIEFVNIISPQKAIMRVWERGAGHTLACGTGATFVVGLGMHLGYFDANVEVVLERGSLFISKENDTMIMEGEADLVFDGEIEL